MIFDRKEVVVLDEKGAIVLSDVTDVPMCFNLLMVAEAVCM